MSCHVMTDTYITYFCQCQADLISNTSDRFLLVLDRTLANYKISCHTTLCHLIPRYYKCHQKKKVHQRSLYDS